MELERSEHDKQSSMKHGLERCPASSASPTPAHLQQEQGCIHKEFPFAGIAYTGL
jgi:hypothetical protein